MFRLFGGAAADTITGGAGNDLIFGNAGADILNGLGGADMFRYQNVNDSTTGSVDQVIGFTHLSDAFDLTRIDANTLLEGDQAFTFIGGAAFSGNGSPSAASAGQLRATLSDVNTNTWRVEGDINGDGIADLIIDVVVQNGQPLTSGDFIM
jgi:Ca2+-binding RTX toxin-like protein